ncbi:hypothetical protein Q1695_000028 [Nippostrongylus brasiliensis]|nr:hypothetical protein Q1695_000028 [Nippostrongylus brasiliensis]
MSRGTITEKQHSRNLPTANARGTSSAASAPRLSPSSVDNVVSHIRMSEKISKYIIEAKCTDNILFASAAAAGVVVLVLQSFPIFMNNWVFLTEPRPINKTNENGEQIESTFHYNVGYFQVCRMYRNNQSGIFYNECEISKSESKYKCYLNPLLSREDLTDHSVASLAVISEFTLNSFRWHE